MKTALLLTLLVFGFISDAEAAVTFSVLANLGASPNGYTPNPAIQGRDGNIYGTTTGGGPSGDGTVYQLATSGTLTTLYSFTGGNDGTQPSGPLLEGADGNYYGTTTAGSGAAQAGTFFRITPTGTLTTLYAFNGATEAAPTLLVLGTDGNFYGTCVFGGGSAASGTVLQITSAGVVTVIHTFVPAMDGEYPNPNIVEGSDGAFYGSTQAGGPSGSGTLFRVTTTGSFSVLANLTSLYGQPLLEALGSNGLIYGIIPYNTSTNHGSVFSMTNAGVQTTVHTFTEQNDGGDPLTLVEGTDGNLYGTTQNGGSVGYGAFFQISSTGTFQSLYGFPSTIAGPSGLVEGTDGNYYATGPGGGPGGAGTILQLTTAGAPTTIYNFTEPGYDSVAALLQASDGNLYGTTEFGGATNDGTIFQITTTGSYTPAADLNFATTGSRPQAPLIQDPTTGKLFGTTTTGGPNYDSALNLGGTVYSLALPGASGDFRIRPAGLEVVEDVNLGPETIWFLDCLTRYGFATPLIINIEPDSDAEPAAKLAKVADGTGTTTPQLLGVSALGGDNNEGVFFDFQPDGTLNSSYSFGDQTTDGSGPESNLVIDSSGNLYGTTAQGGTGTLGTIYKITTTASEHSTLTTIHSFVASTGSSPSNNKLVIGTDGNIYGTTTAGGAYGAGVVFQMTPSGAYKVLHSFDPKPGSAGSDGGTPMAGLIQASDGNFYGTTMFGGADGGGTAYSITSKGVVTILHSFSALDGFQPEAALIQGNDGNLYGVTSGGGTTGGSGEGVIFKITAGLPIPKGNTAQTITFPAIANQTLGAAPIALGATASSGLAVTYAVSGPATLSGSTLTLTGAGTVKVTASQAGNSTYAAATPVSVSFVVGKGTQTITFPAISNQTYGEAAFTLPNPPTASSGLAVTIKVLSGPAKIVGTKVTITGVGAVTLAANQAGNTSYAAAAHVTSSFVVEQASQTIAAFATIPLQYKGEPAFAIVPPKATSGLAVTVTVLSGLATIAADKITVSDTGTVTLAANQAGNADYEAAPQVTTSFVVGPAKQTIAAFAKIAEKQLGAAPFAITIPKASSGLPVTVQVESGLATYSSGTVTVNGAGTVVLEATQDGDADFSPATPVTTSFVVNGMAQTIAAFRKISEKTFGGAPFVIAVPTASSGLGVTATVQSGPATIDSGTVTIDSGTVTLTGAGTVVLVANQAGNVQYNPAKAVTTSFVVAKEAQTIGAFTQIAAQTYGAAPFAVTPPTASSNLPVTVTVKSGPAKISSGTVTLTGVGTVVLSAAQAGNANFLAAKAVTTSFTVAKASQTISAFAVIPTQTAGEVAFAITLPTASSGLAVKVTVLSGPARILGNKVTVTAAGTVVLAANQAGSADYNAAMQVTAQFSVQ